MDHLVTCQVCVASLSPITLTDDREPFSRPGLHWLPLCGAPRQLLTPLLERFIVPAAEKLLRREVTSNMKVLTGRIGPDEKACLAEFSDVCYDFDEFGF